MNPQTVAQTLRQTFVAEQQPRRAAEAMIKQWDGVEGFLSTLLKVCAQASLPVPVRQAAAIHFKNLIKDNWQIKYANQKVQAQDRTPDPLHESDRQFVVQNVTAAAIQERERRIRSQLLEAYFKVVVFEFPNNMSSSMQVIMQAMRSGDQVKISGAAAVLRQIYRKYELVKPEERKPLGPIIDNTFPVLLQLLKQVVDADADIVDAIKSDIAQTFFSAVHLSVPQHLKNNAVLAEWLQTLAKVLLRPVPQSRYPADRDAWPQMRIWDAKEWIACSFVRLFTRFGRPSMVVQVKEFAKNFLTNCAPVIYKVFMEVLRARANGQYVSELTLKRIYSFMSEAVQESTLWNLMKPDVSFLLFKSMLPTLCITKEELMLWRDDPEEYVRRQMDIEAEFTDARAEAGNMMSEFIHWRTRHCLQPILQSVSAILNNFKQNPSEQSAIMLDGGLYMFYAIRKYLLGSEKLKPSVGPILVGHVLPLVSQCKIGFLQARACRILAAYHMYPLEDEPYRVAVGSVVKHLLTSKDKPVVLAALEALNYLLSDPERIAPLLQQHIAMILNKVFQLVDELPHEDVVGCATSLIECMDENIKPMALQICQRLVQVFVRLSQAGDNDNDAAMAAMQTLKTVAALLYALEKHPEVISACEQVLKPLIEMWGPNMFEFEVELLEIFTVLTFYPGRISDYMWSKYPTVISSYTDWAGDAMSHLVPFIDNYVSLDNDRFVNSPYLQGTIKLCEMVLGDTDKRHHAQHMCRVVESIVSNSKGKIDNAVPHIFKIVVTRLGAVVASEQKAIQDYQKQLAQAKANGLDTATGLPQEQVDLSLRLSLLDAVAVLAYYNPQAFLLMCEKASCTQMLINTWLSSLDAMVDNARHTKLAMIGLITLMSVPTSQMPEVVRQGMPTILAEIVRTLHRVIQLAIQARGEYDDDGNLIDSSSASSSSKNNKDDEEVLFEDLDDDADADGEELEAFHRRVFVSGADYYDDWDPVDEDESFDSPMARLDAMELFIATLQHLGRTNSQFYNNWLNSLNNDQKTALQLIGNQVANNNQDNDSNNS